MPDSDRRGPLVHRSVHHAAILLLAGVVSFLVGNALAQWAWDYYRTPPTPVYNLLHNYISDLGAIHCHSYGGRYVCSPWHDVFSGSVILLGLFLILAVPLLKTAFPPRRTRTLGLLLLAIAGVGAMGVGFFPEDFNLSAHTASALTAFLLSNVGILVLSLAMLRDTRWDGFRLFSVVCGLVGLVALGLFAAHAYGPIGVGGMERLIVAPVLLWSAVIAVHLLRVPTFSAPKLASAAP